jgi:uncharacterized phosphosugar-binding protein
MKFEHLKSDTRLLEKVTADLEKVEKEQIENIQKAADMMADAIEQDKLIHVYGGGGHTCLCVCEMFFRAGGLACINPIMDIAISPFNQSLKYLEIERTVNYATGLIRYYDLKKDDVLIIFHNIGVNPATIDAALESRKRGVKIIAVSSSYWQNGLPLDHFIRHPSKKNLFDLADICIDDYNPVGDAVINIEGLGTPMAPISGIVDFYIIHRLEIETVKRLLERGIDPPVWRSANVPGGDEFNAGYVKKYLPLVKNL